MYFYKDFKDYLKAYFVAQHKDDTTFKKTIKTLEPEDWIKLGDKYARHCLKEIHGV